MTRRPTGPADGLDRRQFLTTVGATATEMRRDSDRILDEDNFQVVLDTFMDSRSAYMFVTNPLGAQLDQQIAGPIVLQCPGVRHGEHGTIQGSQVRHRPRPPLPLG